MCLGRESFPIAEINSSHRQNPEMQAFYLGGSTKMRSAAMYPLDIIQEQEKRLQSLEHELIELRQGLAAVHDYFLQIKAQADEKSMSAELNFGIVRPLKDDDIEFEGIW